MSTSKIYLSEPIISAIVSKLQSNLSTYITAVNAEVTDGVTIDAIPTTSILDHVPLRTELVSFPMIGIQEGAYHWEDDTGWGATGVLTLSIVIFLQDPDQGNLVKRLRRTARAVARCVVKGRTVTSSDIWGMRLIRVDPGPTLGREENPRDYMSLIAITIEVRFNEDSPDGG